MTILESGETVVCSCTVKNGSTLTDPDTSMKITIVDSEGTTAVDGVAMTKDSTGTYHYNYTPTKLGVYSVTYVAVNGTKTSKTKDQFRIRSAS
jgi:hypothetical protein